MKKTNSQKWEEYVEKNEVKGEERIQEAPTYSYLRCGKDGTVFFRSETGVACPKCGQRYFSGKTLPPREKEEVGTQGVKDGKLLLLEVLGFPGEYLFVGPDGMLRQSPLGTIEKLLRENGTPGQYAISK